MYTWISKRFNQLILEFLCIILTSTDFCLNPLVALDDLAVSTKVRQLINI